MKSMHKRSEKKKRKGKRTISLKTPIVDPSLKEDLEMIGAPVDSTFRPDPFQIEALELIKQIQAQLDQAYQVQNNGH